MVVVSPYTVQASRLKEMMHEFSTNKDRVMAEQHRRETDALRDELSRQREEHKAQMLFEQEMVTQIREARSLITNLQERIVEQETEINQLQQTIINPHAQVG